MDTILIIAVICAYVVKGLCCFANTLVFTSILSFSTSNATISPLELIVGYPSNLVIAFKERKSVKAKVWIPLSSLVIVGSVPGVILLKHGNVQWIKVLFGFVVFFIALEMFLREYQKNRRKQSRFVLMVIGILSGLLCGIFGIGALLAAYVSRTSNNSNEFRGNLCMVFLIENTFRIILYSITGILTVAILKQAFLLIPFMGIGLMVGMMLARYIDEKVVKKLIIILLMLSGISLILNNL